MNKSSLVFKRIWRRIASYLLDLSRSLKQTIVVGLDAVLCVFTVWIALYLRMGDFSFSSYNVVLGSLVALILVLPTFQYFGLYLAVFRYTGWHSLMLVVKACAVYGTLYASFFMMASIDYFPRTVGFIQPLLFLLFAGGVRALARFWLGGVRISQSKLQPATKVLIYGAGQSGRELAMAMTNNPEMKVIGFLDDDPQLQGRVLNGLPIYDPKELKKLIVGKLVKSILLALPSVGRKRRNEILEQIRHANISVQTLPSFTEMAQGRVSFTDLRELQIDDLLGRDPVPPDPVLMAKTITGKIVLVTGAGGSIGSELCRQIMRLDPAILLLVEQSEFALYDIHQTLSTKFTHNPTQIVPLLASVCDGPRMKRILANWNVDTLYHAAAYKHVPLVEHNPAEGVRNNTIGTWVTAHAAKAANVSTFVLISTDKAVRPTNVMGASKRMAELILQALAVEKGKTLFTMVRFGNVLGSSGSVVPKFRQQIKSGGPITITHADIIRYFLTIPEASQLVIQAAAMAEGGDVFVLDMGAPVKIIDLARRMVELSGLTVKNDENPAGDIEITITGMRPGEKLYEELLIGNNPEATEHSRIMKANETHIPYAQLCDEIQQLESLLDADDSDALRAFLVRLVGDYNDSSGNVDWLHSSGKAYLGANERDKVVSTPK